MHNYPQNFHRMRIEYGKINCAEPIGFAAIIGLIMPVDDNVGDCHDLVIALE